MAKRGRPKKEKPKDSVEIITEEDDGVELIDELEEENKDEVPELSSNDEGWTDFILSKLRPKEKSDGHPKVDGLRRLVEEYVGNIIANRTEIIQCPSQNNGLVATVVSTIIVQQLNGKEQTYDGAADATKFNSKPPFDKHLTAVAETRAEGRAFRKLLRLQSVITAEEAQYGVEGLEEISPNQIIFINQLCLKPPRGLDINVQKLVLKIAPNVTSIRSLTHDQGIAINKMLSGYQQDESAIEEDIKGYDSGWKDYFG